jgi:hypothetical protein
MLFPYSYVRFSKELYNKNNFFYLPHMNTVLVKCICLEKDYPEQDDFGHSQLAVFYNWAQEKYSNWSLIKSKFQKKVYK